MELEKFKKLYDSKDAIEIKEGWMLFNDWELYNYNTTKTINLETFEEALEHKIDDKTISILKEWETNKVASAKSERQFREEINKMDYEEILKLAQRIDETDLARTTSNASFSLNTALDNIIKVGRRKNANKWSTDFGKWRK